MELALEAASRLSVDHKLLRASKYDPDEDEDEENREESPPALPVASSLASNLTPYASRMRRLIVQANTNDKFCEDSHNMIAKAVTI